MKRTKRIVIFIFLISFVFSLQVHFNLELSEKEQIDRSKVVLPFEHQGIGQKAFLVGFELL